MAPIRHLTVQLLIHLLLGGDLNFLSNLMWTSSRGRPASAATIIEIWYDVIRNQMRWPKGEFIPLDFEPTASTGAIDWTWFD